MPRTKSTKRAETLGATLNPKGKNDPIVEAMLSEDFLKASDLEAAKMAMKFSDFISGQNALMEATARNTDIINKMLEKMAATDEMLRKFDEDRQRWMEEVHGRAESLKYPENIKDRKNAESMIDVQDAIVKARATIQSDKLMFDQEIAKMPRETIISPGKLEIVRNGDSQNSVIMNEEVRIKHRVWVLPAGKPVEVPKCVADLLRDRRRSEAETDARKAAMSSNMESGELTKALKDIDTRFGSPTLSIGEPNV